MGYSNTARRKFLKSTLSVTGIGISAQVTAAANLRRQTIVSVAKGRKPVIKKEVPEKWYNEIRRTRKLRERFLKREDKNPNIVGMMIGNRDKAVGELNRPKLTAVVRDVSKASNRVANNIEGIPVDLKEYTPSQLHCDDSRINHNYEFYDPYPGGTLIESKNGIATSCCAVRNSDGLEGILTAAHVVMDDDTCNNPNGNRVAQECDLLDGATSEDKLGEVIEYRTATDMAVVEKTPDNDISDITNDIMDGEGEISGRLTEDGVQEAMSSNEDVVRVGINSGRNTGTIDNMYYSERWADCGYFDDGDWIQYSNSLDGGDGDSGGPYFVERYNDLIGRYIAVVGMHAQAGPEGPSAYSIYQNYGWAFGK